MAASSASQRPAATKRSPRRSTPTPAAIGSQIRRESRGECILLLSSGAGEEPAEQRGQADHDPEGIRVEIAVLHAPHDAAEPSDRGRGTVDQRPVDDALLARLPQTEADATRERRDQLLVDPVEVVLLYEERAQPAESPCRLIRERRTPEETDPGRREPRNHQPKRGAEKTVEPELPRTEEFPRHLADDVVGRQDENGAAEIAAEEHRTHGEVADEERWNGERDERHGHHPGALVWLRRVMAMLRRMRRGFRVRMSRAAVRGLRHLAGGARLLLLLLVPHRLRALVIVGVVSRRRMAEALLAMEGHEEQPEENGVATRASPPIQQVTAVIGMYLPRPPILRMSCSWCIPMMTEPAARNSSALKNACVIRWKIAAL